MKEKYKTPKTHSLVNQINLEDAELPSLQRLSMIGARIFFGMVLRQFSIRINESVKVTEE